MPASVPTSHGRFGQISMCTARIFFLMALSCPLATAMGAEADSAVDEIVASERAFAARAQVVNARQAFAEFFAPDAVLFIPFATPAFPRLREAANWEVNIQWRPVAAAASGAGDMGYTTGPAEYRRSPAEAPSGFGHYTSVWQRQADGRFRVRVDLGVDHGAPAEPIPDWVPSASPVPSGHALDAAARDAAQRELESIDARSGRADVAATKPALLEALAEDVRWQRSGRLPVVGRERVIDAIAASGEALEWTPEVTAVADSGDFGYAYGRGRSTATGQERSEFAYLNIWQRRDGGWRLIVHTSRRVQAPAN